MEERPRAGEVRHDGKRARTSNKNYEQTLKSWAPSTQAFCRVARSLAEMSASSIQEV